MSEHPELSRNRSFPQAIADKLLSAAEKPEESEHQQYHRKRRNSLQGTTFLLNITPDAAKYAKPNKKAPPASGKKTEGNVQDIKESESEVLHENEAEVEKETEFAEKEAGFESEVDRESGSEEHEVIALDGGYGWVVMIASFFASVIVDGVCFAFGIFYLEFLETFQEDRSKTAWIGSVLNGMYMVTAPISGALAKKFGCRPVAMIGSTWATVAFIGSTFSGGVTTLIITYGVLGGIGFGLMYLPSIVMVAAYFDKRRALATGVATCGSGIGAFVFAPLCKALIEIYGWQGAQWIVAGLVLHGVILGALYRPLTEKDVQRYHQNKHKQNDKIDASSIDRSIADHKFKDSHCHNGDRAEKKRGFYLDDANPEEDIAMLQNGDYTSSLQNSKTDDGNRKQYDKVVSGSLYSLASVESLTVRNQKLADNQKEKSTGREVLDNLLETMDVSIVKNTVFDIYGFSCILCMAGFFVPFTYLPDHCLSLGYTKAQGAFLLSILGITNTVGRIIAGWLSDRSWADCLLINNISLIVGGLGTIACPFCTTYWLLCIYACVFGLCIAAFVSLRSIILVDLIGLERLTSSFGLLVLCQGISSFFGSPLAGFLYDLTDSYDLSFYVAGTVIALAGIICLPLRKLAACQNHTNAEKDF